MGRQTGSIPDTDDGVEMLHDGRQFNSSNSWSMQSAEDDLPAYKRYLRGCCGLSEKFRAYQGKMLLLTAVTLLGMKSAAFKYLNKSDKNLFTPCSTICTSQTITLFVIFIFKKDDVVWERITAVRSKEWLAMCGIALAFNVFGPFLEYGALDAGMSNSDKSILAQLSPLYLMMLAKPAGVRQDWPSKTETFIVGIMFLGMLMSFVVPSLVLGKPVLEQMGPGVSPLFMVLAALADPISILLNKRYLRGVPIGILCVFRNLVGTVVYHAVALYRGKNPFCFSFGDPRAVTLWLNMLWYGGLLTAIPKICFLMAILRCSPLTLSIGINALFFINLLAGAVILGESPSGLRAYGIGTIGFALCLTIYTEYRKALKQGTFDEESEFNALMKPARTDNRAIEQKRGTYIGERRLARGVSFHEEFSMYELWRGAVTI